MSLLLVIGLLIPPFAQQTFLALPDSDRNENVILREIPVYAYSYLIDYVSHDPINIISNADFAAQKEIEGWAGNGTVDDPYIIEGYNITYNGYNIRISNVTAHFIIRSCYLASIGTTKNDPYDDGVNFYNVTSGTVMNNIMFNNTDGGIYLGDSKGTIANNIMIDNRHSIILANSSASVTRNEVTGSNNVSIYVLDSFNSVISRNYASAIYGESILLDNATGCTVTDNDFEIHSATFRSSRNCTISKNRCREGSGILIDSSSDIVVFLNSIVQPAGTGIEVYRSNITTVSYNTINGADGDGILVHESEICRYYGNRVWGGLDGISIIEVTNSNFTFNHIQSQQYYGIDITTGSENILYGNLLTMDGYGPAIDWGVYNQWDDGAFMGNFWEGIEEGSLEIYGTANSVDRFARAISDEDFYYPHIRPEPIVHKLGGIGASLTWIVYCEPFDYEIYVNDTPIDSGRCLDTNAVTIDISDLPNGYYSFVLRVYPLYMMIDPGYITSTPFHFTVPDIWFLDSDADDMPDVWEIANGLNPYVDDSGLDYDSDGLFNNEEYFEGTDPRNPDSDSDSIFDGWEVRYGLDPLNASDASLDFDYDKLTNLEEYILGTNPTSSDSDSDGFPDAWEVRNGFDPTNPAVSLWECFVFYSPIMGAISVIVIAVVGVLFARYEQSSLQRRRSVRDEEEEEQEALSELLQ